METNGEMATFCAAQKLITEIIVSRSGFG